MKQASLLRNPFFYLSTLLFVVLVFQVAQVAAGTWTFQQPPDDCTPGSDGCSPAQPLDASGFGQMKTGDLTVTGRFNVLGGVRVGPDDTNKVQIQHDARRIDFIDTGQNAAILFEDGKLKANHDVRTPDWFDIGSGTGEGLWTRTGAGSFASLVGTPNGISVGSITIEEGDLTLNPRIVPGGAARTEYFYRPKRIMFRHSDDVLCQIRNIPAGVSVKQAFMDSEGCQGRFLLDEWLSTYRNNRLSGQCDNGDDSLYDRNCGDGPYEARSSDPSLAYDLFVEVEYTSFSPRRDVTFHPSVYEYERYGVSVSAGEPLFVGGNISANGASFTGNLMANGASFTGNLMANGASLRGNASVNGNVSVGGLATFVGAPNSGIKIVQTTPILPSRVGGLVVSSGGNDFQGFLIMGMGRQYQTRVSGGAYAYDCDPYFGDAGNEPNALEAIQGANSSTSGCVCNDAFKKIQTGRFGHTPEEGEIVYCVYPKFF